MYVSEESDSGIVPMNHSNKERTPSAENEEGRPLSKENIVSAQHVPDTERGLRVPWVSRWAGAAYRCSPLLSELRAVCAN